MSRSLKPIHLASAVFPRSTHLSPLGRSLRVLVSADASRIALLQWEFPWEDLSVLWRYTVYGSMVLTVLFSSISSRVDIQRTLKQIDRNTHMQREAQVLNQRLLLETDTRLRAVRLEQMALELGLGRSAKMVRSR